MSSCNNVKLRTQCGSLEYYFPSLPVYASNSAAISGGLVAGQLYRTSDGTVKVVLSA